VIVINAEKVRVTGRKETDKMYRHFTGYPGGLVEKSFKRCGRKARPPGGRRHFRHASQDQARKQMYRKLKVYAGDKHPHAAQKPAALAVK